MTYEDILFKLKTAEDIERARQLLGYAANPGAQRQLIADALADAPAQVWYQTQGGENHPRYQLFLQLKEEYRERE